MMDENNYNEIEDSTEDMPREVKDFVFGEEMDEFEKAVAEIAKQKASSIRMAVELFLLGEKDIEELTSSIETLPLSPDEKTQIKVLIQEKVFDELLLAIEVREEIEKEEKMTQETDNVSTSTPSNVLETLKTRLTQPKGIAPVAKPASEQKTVAPSPQPPAIDPYKERIE